MPDNKYYGLSRNTWPGTWSPSASHPIVLDREIRGGLRYAQGGADSGLTDIEAQRLEDGMVVYLDDSSGSFKGGIYYKYKVLPGQNRDSSTGELPNSDSNWAPFRTDSGGDVTFGTVTLTGELRGPGSLVIDPLPLASDSAGQDSAGKELGTVVIKGNLDVRGAQTIVQSGTLTIVDKNIVLADSARDSADADGAGFTVNGANAKLTYLDSDDTWNFNKPLGATVFKGDILPNSDSAYNLGSAAKRWGDLFLSGSTIDLGGVQIKKNVGGGVSFLDDSGNKTSIDVDSAIIRNGIFLVNDSGVGKTIGFNDSGQLSFPGRLVLDSGIDVGTADIIGHYVGFDSDLQVAHDSNVGLGLIYDSSHKINIDSDEIEYFKTPIRKLFGVAVGGDLQYDSINGVFALDVESAYTAANFDSDFTIAMDSAALGGIGLTYDSSKKSLSIDSAELENFFGKHIRSFFSVSATPGSGDLQYDSVTGVFALDVESAYTATNFDSDFRDRLVTTTTDSIGEGDSNLYYLTSRADSDAKRAIQVVDSGGDGSLSYDNTLGIINYNGPSEDSIRSHFSAGHGVAIDSGQIRVDSTAEVTINSMINTSGDITTSPSEVLVSSASVTIIDTIIHEDIKQSIEYLVHLFDSSGNDTQITKMLATYDGTVIASNEFGTVFTGSTDLGDLDIALTGTNINLTFQRYATGSINNVRAKVSKTIIK